MKKRIIGGILAVAMAIVPFTGTGIEAIDKAVQPAVITASASTGFSYVLYSTSATYMGGRVLVKYTYKEYYCGRFTGNYKVEYKYV